MQWLNAWLARLRALPGAEGPLVRWGLLLIIVILLWSLVLQPWPEALEQRRELLAARAQELARLQRLQTHSEAWRAVEARFERALQKAAGYLLKATSATAAKAELQALLASLVKRHHLRVEGSHFLPAADQPGLGKRVAVQGRLVGAMADVYRFLDALARNDRLLVIERLNLGRRTSGEIGVFIQVAGFIAAPGGG